MPKKLTNSSPQLPFMKRDIPQMPEGYYSSGPNPNLAKFVEENSTPYDPATDNYDVPPFDKPITTTKATAIYNMHTYWSKKPHDAIQQYIRHYTQPGDLVLDPFCGSGGTALAALMEGRNAIAIDLSPAATFITKNYCTSVDVDELQRAFEELKAKVKPEMDWLYETRCDRCDGKATTAYTVYSQVFECPRCLEKVALFDCPEVKSQTQSGKEKMMRVCPHCMKRGLEEEISTSSKKFGSIPVLISYRCEEGCKPVRGERRHDDPNPKKREYFNKIDLSKIKEIEDKELPYWYPENRMMNSITNDNERWGLLWRPYHFGINKVSDFYTKRNLWAIATIVDALSNLDTKFKDQIYFCLTSNIYKASIMMGHNKDGIGRIQKGILYIPPIEHDINLYSFLNDTFPDLITGFQEINNMKSTNLCISTCSSDNLGFVDNSIDYIFTDPPYGGTVQYGELNFLWEAWLRFDTNWKTNEVIVNQYSNKTDSDWADALSLIMKECFRVLKPNRWISICFHDSSEGTWQLIQDLMAETGFVSEVSSSALFIDTSTKTIKQLFSENITKRDLVINFRKPRAGELAPLLLITGNEDAGTFREKAFAILIESLERKPGQFSDTLYDELVSRMVRKGSFERHNFIELLKTVAEESASRWYLKESSGIDEAEARRESSSAQKLEEFMTTFLISHSIESGVHYSDLFEQYLPISDKPRRLMQEWLPEYFFKTPEGTWRPPQTDEERQQKSTLRATGELRKIKRFLNALNEGVPPGEKDKPANAATLAEWIYQCRRAGLYDMGKTLYEKGGLRFDELKESLQVQVEEDYQLCAKRGAEKKEQETSKHKKKIKNETPPLEFPEE